MSESPLARRARRGLPTPVPRLRLTAMAALACATMSSTPPLWAQTAPTTEPQTLVITGSREPLAAERLVADVQVIDAERIRHSGADSLEALLQREAGLQLSRTGGPGQTAGALIRGTAATNTVVLVDGVRVGSATLGQTALNTLSLAQVERIEVLRGPASSLYGADAVGGVVQIVTRRGRGPTRVDARLAAGARGSAEASLGVQGAGDAVDVSLGLSAERSDGVSALRPGDTFGNYNADADGFERLNLQAQLGWAPDARQRLALRVQAGRLDAQYDGSQFLPPDFAQDASPDFRNDGHTRLLALEHSARLDGGLRTRLAASTQVDDLSAGAAVRDRFRSQRRQVAAQLSGVGQEGDGGRQWTAALEHLEDEATSTSYLSPAQRRNTAAVLAYAGRHGGVDLQADLRHDANSRYGGVSTWRAGAGLPLAEGWRVRALAGTSFRAPSYNELVFPGYGVLTLSPERGRSLEAGVEGRFDAGQVSATVWRNQVRDLIAYESDAALCPTDPQYAFGCARNLARARLQGLSLAAGTAWGAWSLRTRLEWLDAKDEATGARLNRRAAQQFSAGADYVAGPWRASVEWLRLGRRPDGGATLAAESTLDVALFWRLAPRWQLELKLLNATDEDLQPVRDYNGAPRQAWIGLRFEGGAP